MLSRIQEIQLKNQIQRVLHVPGNYNGGPLEMAVVFDSALEKEDASAAGKQIAAVLKSMGDTFRNVRLNLVLWNQAKIRHEISAVPHLITGNAFREFEHSDATKILEELCGNLKLFQARSRLVILVTKESWEVNDAARLKENLNPFLYRRMILITESEVKPGISLLQKYPVS